MYKMLPGEQLDDLQDRGYKIIQDPNDYCFTSDAVLLANFAKVKKSETLCDLCSGSGIVSTLLQLKKPYSKAFLVELNTAACDRARRSAEGNNFEHFEVINIRLQDATQKINEHSIDVVTVNPPYMEQSVGEQEKTYGKAIARWEIELNLTDVIQTAAKLLKYGGRFYMIHSTNRLVDCLSTMRQFGIEPKVLQMVYPKQSSDSNVFLVEGKARGHKGLKVIAPHIVR